MAAYPVGYNDCLNWLSERGEPGSVATLELDLREIRAELRLTAKIGRTQKNPSRGHTKGGLWLSLNLSRPWPAFFRSVDQIRDSQPSMVDRHYGSVANDRNNIRPAWRPLLPNGVVEFLY